MNEPTQEQIKKVKGIDILPLFDYALGIIFLIKLSGSNEKEADLIINSKDFKRWEERVKRRYVKYIINGLPPANGG